MKRPRLIERADVEPALGVFRRWAQEHPEWVRFAALLGSVREGAAYRGYSDLDLLLILKSDRRGGVPDRCVAALRALADRIQAASPLPVSLLPHTEHDLRGYVDASYLLHYSWGEVLVGNARAYARMFRSLAKETDAAAVAAAARHSILHARFNMVRKYVSAGRSPSPEVARALAKTLLDWCIELADWGNLVAGVAVAGKERIAAEFSSAYPRLQTRRVPAEAVALRARWHEAADAELGRFSARAIALVRELAATLS